MSFVPEKRLAIVVGLGKGGIGDHLAKRFSTEYNVALVARSDLKHLESEIPNSKSYQCDAGDPKQVASTVEAIRKDAGSDEIHVLLYNVGSGVFKDFDSTSYEEFELSWRVGPAGLFLWTKTVKPFMPDKGSSIGITGATASWRGMPYTAAFASSKMATRGLAQALARDLGPKNGIHVFHVIIDGMVKLDQSKASDRPDNEWLHPADIAETYWQMCHQPPNCWTQEIHVGAQGAFGSIASI
jgi:NAD(P)-dependent dehydrogenase (short-subunit alcohol dehydrogenase family)